MSRLSYRQTLMVLDQYGQRTRDCWQNAFYVLDKDLPAFKVVCTNYSMDAIANLIIPAGTEIHVGLSDGFVKCRAEKAHVHSIFTKEDLEEVKVASSWNKREFKYHPGKSVIPEYGFDYDFGACGKGIHFFVDLQSALKYI